MKGEISMGKMAVITRKGILKGAIVEVIPEGYLQQDWAWVEHPKTKIQFPVKKEDLLIV